MNPIRAVIRHPAIAGPLGAIIGYRAAGGSLFAQCLAAVSAAMYMDAKEAHKRPLLTGTVTPAKPGDVAEAPPPKPRNRFMRVFVFVFSFTFTALLSYGIVRGLLLQ